MTASVRALAAMLGLPAAELQAVVEAVPKLYVRRVRWGGGKRRRISAPRKALKSIQRLILMKVLRLVEPHESSYCVPGRSALQNARQHLGNAHVSTFDICDAFPSVSPKTLRRALSREFRRVGVPLVVIDALVRLCTLDGELPQGAPTSTSLLDIALRKHDEDFSRHCARRGARYSRYVDDLAVSGKRSHPWAEKRLKVGLAESGLYLNDTKSRPSAPPRRAIVTGIVLRERAELPALKRIEIVRQIEAIVSAENPPSGKDLSRVHGLLGYLQPVHPRIARRLRALVQGAEA